MRGVGVALLLVSSVMLLTVRGEGICNMTAKDFDACKPSVTPPKPAPPSAACCKALAGANLPCLCSYKRSPLLLKLGIDPGLAMKLPPKCNLKMPSKCADAIN